MLLLFHISAVVKTIFISAITIAALLGIMVRPWKITEASAALIGAALLLVLGLIGPIEVTNTLLGDWNTFLFFSGINSGCIYNSLCMADTIILSIIKWSMLLIEWSVVLEASNPGVSREENFLAYFWIHHRNVYHCASI